MSYSKKSKFIISISVILATCIIFCACVLGAGVGIKNKKLPYRVKIGAQIQKTKDIDEAVSAAIKADEKCRLGSECLTEGHIILDIKENEGKVKIYTIASIGFFGFENGIFTKVSGSGAIPTVITLSKNENGEYELIEYATPFDGTEYAKSIKKMFPRKLHFKALNANKSYPELAKQEESQAEEYLKSIGRKAKVSAKFVEKKLAEINVKASNKLFADLTRYDKFLNSCPYWLGTREQVEDGVRYIYETSKGKTSDGFNTMIFRKTKEDGTLIKERIYKIVGSEPTVIHDFSAASEN